MYETKMFIIGQAMENSKPVFLSPELCDELGIAYNPHELEDTEIFGMCLQMTYEEYIEARFKYLEKYFGKIYGQ